MEGTLEKRPDSSSAFSMGLLIFLRNVQRNQISTRRIENCTCAKMYKVKYLNNCVMFEYVIRFFLVFTININFFGYRYCKLLAVRCPTHPACTNTQTTNYTVYYTFTHKCNTCNGWFDLHLSIMLMKI